jgi:hypothetical protein
MAIGVATAAVTNRRPANETVAKAGDAIANAASAIGIATAIARARRPANATAAKAGVAITNVISTTGAATAIARARRPANRIAANRGAAITTAISAAGAASTIASGRRATSVTDTMAMMDTMARLRDTDHQEMGRMTGMTDMMAMMARHRERSGQADLRDPAMGRRMMVTTVMTARRRAHLDRADLRVDMDRRPATISITTDMMVTTGRRRVPMARHLASTIATINRLATAIATTTCCTITISARRTMMRNRTGIATG